VGWGVGAPEVGGCAPEVGAPEVGAPEVGAAEVGAPGCDMLSLIKFKGNNLPSPSLLVSIDIISFILKPSAQLSSILFFKILNHLF